MVKLSQRDPKWALEKIGKSKLTLGRYGCTITSICMIHSKFYPKSYILPPEAAKIWAFTDDGLIKWTDCKFDGMKFLKRGYGYNKEEIREAVKNPDKGVIVQVDGFHWIAANDYFLGVLGFNDPWNGDTLYKFSKRYKDITGYAIFAKN
jgi:hypothetical protein